MIAERNPDKVYNWSTPAGEVRARRRAEMIIQGAGLKRNIYALEIGCGSGLFTELFLRTGAYLTAIDISLEMLRKTIERTKLYMRVRYLRRNFETGWIGCGTFNAIVGSSVLHHLDILVALKRAYKLLEPGGRVCFAEPNILNPQVFIERKFRRYFWYISQTETAYNRWFIKNMMERVGFIDVKVTPFDWLHPATPEYLIKIVSKIGGWLEKTPIIKEFAGSLHIQGRKP